MSRYPRFDRRDILLRPISHRTHDLLAENVLPLVPPAEPLRSLPLARVAEAIRKARHNKRPVVLMLGGHPIKLGLSKFINHLIEQEFITLVATNGAGIIHDFELATCGGTSEDVSKNIRQGRFGNWEETSSLNRLITEAARGKDGLGETVGRNLARRETTTSYLSIAATGWRNKVPVTCHVTVGADIIHQHINCDGAALGEASYTDFLIFTRHLQDLEGGVFLNVGSAVTGPEVYLKALSMVRNASMRTGAQIRDFTTAVFDMVPLPENWHEGTPGKSDPGYYFRPWKTILIRTVADGGISYYVQGEHQRTIPTLWHMLTYDK